MFKGKGVTVEVGNVPGCVIIGSSQKLNGLSTIDSNSTRLIKRVETPDSNSNPPKSNFYKFGPLKSLRIKISLKRLHNNKSDSIIQYINKSDSIIQYIMT